MTPFPYPTRPLPITPPLLVPLHPSYLLPPPLTETPLFSPTTRPSPPQRLPPPHSPSRLMAQLMPLLPLPSPAPPLSSPSPTPSKMIRRSPLLTPIQHPVMTPTPFKTAPAMTPLP